MQKPCSSSFFFFQAEDGIRDVAVTGVQTCALPICLIPVNQQIKSSSDEMPFSANYRASGVLVHVTSLPSPHGIGDLGPAAISWINRLSEFGQSWWQSLPLGPTGYGNSPYQPLSSFAGNALVISPDCLIEDELLERNDTRHPSFSTACVDYDTVIPFKHSLLEKAWGRFKAGARADLRQAYEQFCQDQSHWLDDYALFRALKAEFGNAPYPEWPDDLVQRKPAALERDRLELIKRIGLARFAQLLVSRQAERLKSHARAKGLRLIGDLPRAGLSNRSAWRNTKNCAKRARPIRSISSRRARSSAAGLRWTKSSGHSG